MVSEDQAVGIVKSVATSLGYPDMVVKIPKRNTENAKSNEVRGISTKDHPRIIRMYKKGMSTEDVMKKFPYTKMQLAAVKAWITMGKY